MFPPTQPTKTLHAGKPCSTTVDMTVSLQLGVAAEWMPEKRSAWWVEMMPIYGPLTTISQSLQPWAQNRSCHSYVYQQLLARGQKPRARQCLQILCKVLSAVSGIPTQKPLLAILDPEVTVNLPADLTAWTGCDALVHAIEAFSVPDWKPSL